MVTARVYQPSKTAMQSGKAKTKYWLLEINNCEDKYYDPLMGWVASKSTGHQVRLKFTTLEDALAHVKTLGLDFIVELTKSTPAINPKSYADNFRYTKPPMFE